VDIRLSQFVLELFIYLSNSFGSINSNTVVLLLKAFDDWQSFICKSIQSLLDCLWIVISPTAGLSSLHDAVD